MVTLLGGQDITVKLRTGASEIVTVRQISVREFPSLLEAIDDEPKTIEILTGKQVDWVDLLTHESHAELLKLGEEVNGGDFFNWLRRRVKRQEQLVPGSSGALGKSLLSASQTGSPSAPSAAA